MAEKDKPAPPPPSHVVVLDDSTGYRRGSVLPFASLPDAAKHIDAGKARAAQPLDIAVAGLSASSPPPL